MTTGALNLAEVAIGRAARATPDKVALIVVGDPSGGAIEVWTFGELDRAVLKVAAGLRRWGLEPGARVMIRLENSSRYALLFFGAIAAGLVPLPTSTQLSRDEVEFLLADGGCALAAMGEASGDVVLPAGCAAIMPDDIARFLVDEQPRGYAPTVAEDPAFLIYTSGTTARPKGVLHAQRSILGRQPMYQGWYGLGACDRMLHAGAFNWTFTLGTGLSDPWACGATAIVYTGERAPDVWPRLISATGATLFAAVPGIYRQMLKYGADDLRALGVLRHGLMAGETPPPGLFDDWQRATGRELFEALGMSEVSTYISSGPEVPRRVGHVGKPQKGRRVAILARDGEDAPLPRGEDGLLAVHRSDPGLMLGYWRRPEEEAEVFRGEWFVGGDVARMDADGYVAHLGRDNDVMKALGYRVSPQEVEAVLARFAGVGEVACAEVRVRADVTVIGAFIVAADAARPPDLGALERYAAEHLAAYKRPRQYALVAALPRTANGKVRRVALGGVG